MSQQSRRKKVKRLALTIPTVWAIPVVSTVILPAHAQTSPCGAPEGCYQLPEGGSTNSFFWPGGSEAFLATTYSDANCEESFSTELIAAAADAEQAEELLTAASEPCEPPAQEVPVLNPPPGGCRFFDCD